MTYDPDRDAKAPRDMNPNVRPADRPRGMGMGLWVGLLAALAIATFILFNSGRDNNVATDRPVTNPPATTGSSPTVPAPATRDMGTGTNPPAATPTPSPAPKQ